MYSLFIDLRPDFFLLLREVVYRQMLSNEVLLLSKVNCSSERSLLGFQKDQRPLSQIQRKFVRLSMDLKRQEKATTSGF